MLEVNPETVRLVNMSIGNGDIGCSLDSGAFAIYSVLVLPLLSMNVLMFTVSRYEYLTVKVEVSKRNTSIVSISDNEIPTIFCSTYLHHKYS